MIRNIIFDIGGVLVDFNPLKTMREMGISEADAQSIARTTVLGPHWKELDRGVMPKEEVFSMMIADTDEGLRKDAGNFLQEEVLRKTVTSFSYSSSWLKSLRDRGYRIYLLTNYPSWLFDYHWENTFTFSNLVDGEVVSAKVNFIKPDHRIYEHLLDRYSLKPEECVFIDDREENTEAAEKAGIRTVHFDTYENASSRLNSLIEKD